MTRTNVLLIATALTACSGSSFSSSGGAGGSGTGGGHTGGQGVGGGSSSGGSVSAGGNTGTAGGVNAGGTIGAGGAVGTAGDTGMAGAGGGKSCDTMWTDYLLRLDAARTCQLGGMECSLDSTLPNRCGCQVLVNPNRSANAQQAFDSLTAAGCHFLVCPIACVVPTAVKCAVESSTSTRAVCTAG